MFDVWWEENPYKLGMYKDTNASFLLEIVGYFL